MLWLQGWQFDESRQEGKLGAYCSNAAEILWWPGPRSTYLFISPSISVFLLPR